MALAPGKYASTWGFAGVLLGNLVFALDAVALSPSPSAIQDSLHISTLETYWAGVAYTLGSATFLPLFPATSITMGRRFVCLVALILYLLGTIVCATAQNVAALLSGRILQGMGGGGIVGMMYVVVTDLFTPAWRPKALGINGLVWLVGMAVGPVMGGGFSNNFSWRWMFWTTVPIDIVAVLLVLAFLDIPLSAEQRASREYIVAVAGVRLPDVDYLGAILLVVSLSAAFVPITWGGVMFPWGSYQTLIPLILGIAGFVAWLAYESKIPRNPILRMSTLNDCTVAISLVAAFTIGVLQFSLIFYLPRYYEVVKGYSAMTAGLALLPETLGSGPSTFAISFFISKTKKYKTVIILGWSVTAIGCLLLTLLNEDTSVAAWIFLNLPIGIGIGILFPSCAVATQAPVAPEHVAVTAGLVAFLRAVGQTLGVAVGNALFQNVLKQRLLSATSSVLRDNATLIAGHTISQGIISSFLTRGPQERRELLDAYVESLRSIWWLLFGLSCCCWASSYFMRDLGIGKSVTMVDDEGQRPAPAARSPAELGLLHPNKSLALVDMPGQVVPTPSFISSSTVSV